MRYGFNFETGQLEELPDLPPVEPTLEELKAERLAATAERRWQAETGGISVAGIDVRTDDRSKLMLTGARVKAAADAGFETQWVTADGQIVPLAAAQIIAISDAVLAHVDLCFAHFAGLAAAIAAAADEPALAAIDVEAGWPGG